MIKIEKIGRRHYLRNTPFAMRDALRSAGAKWDPDQRCWWTGKREIAEQLASEEAPASSRGGEREAPGLDAKVSGRATYKGKSYYIAGRETEYGCEAVTTRDGGKFLLYFRDGSRSFWADRTVVSITKTYTRRLQTIRRLQEFAAEARQAGGADAALEARAERSGRCRGCGGPIVDAPHHAALGGYCGRCAFDEYDC